MVTLLRWLNLGNHCVGMRVTQLKAVAPVLTGENCQNLVNQLVPWPLPVYQMTIFQCNLFPNVLNEIIIDQLNSTKHLIKIDMNKMAPNNFNSFWPQKSPTKSFSKINYLQYIQTGRKSNIKSFNIFRTTPHHH